MNIKFYFVRPMPQLVKKLMVFGALCLLSLNSHAADTFSPWFENIAKYRLSQDGLILFVDLASDPTREHCQNGSGESGYIIQKSDDMFDEYFSALIAAFIAKSRIRIVVADVQDCVFKHVKIDYFIVQN